MAAAAGPFLKLVAHDALPEVREHPHAALPCSAVRPTAARFAPRCSPLHPCAPLPASALSTSLAPGRSTQVRCLRGLSCRSRLSTSSLSCRVGAWRNPVRRGAFPAAPWPLRGGALPADSRPPGCWLDPSNAAVPTLACSSSLGGASTRPRPGQPRARRAPLLGPHSSRGVGPSTAKGTMGGGGPAAPSQWRSKGMKTGALEHAYAPALPVGGPWACSLTPTPPPARWQT
jgi:hypothetical protein